MKVSYRSEDYTLAASKSQQLVLALEEQGCGVSVYDKKGTQLLLGHCPFEESLKSNESLFYDVVRSEDVLRQNYESTYIVLSGHKSTVVPVDFFDDLQPELYLKHLYTLDKEEIVKHSPLASENAVLVFATPDFLYYPARSKFYDAIIENITAVNIRAAKSHGAEALHAFFENGYFQLVHYGKKLEFFNSFDCHTIEEAMYFIMNYYAQFNKNRDVLQLIIHNLPDSFTSLVPTISKYLGRISEASPRTATAGVEESYLYPQLLDFKF